MNDEIEIFIGIDTGKDGAICATTKDGAILNMFDMPRDGHNVDIGRLYTIMERFTNCKVFITVEKMFIGFDIKHANLIWQQAENFRTVICAIHHAGLQNSYTIVMPRSWQSKMIDGKASKSKSIKTAIKMSGRNDIFIKGKDGRAEAFLISEYMRNIKQSKQNKQDKQNKGE